MGESSCSSQMNKMNFKFLLAVFVVAVALMPTAHSLSLTTKTSPDPTEPTSTLPPSTLPPSTASPSTASPSLASPTTDCQAGWSAFNGNCYKFFSEEKTWENAKDQCVEEQANLVSLHSEEEHQFVVGLNGGFPWLGGRRDPGNGNNFVWSDGTPWDYTNWARGAPDNNKGNEDCAHMKKKVAERHKWNDRPCSHVRTFVCKKDSTTAEQVSELPLESIFGPGHAGVIQRTAFRPSLNQTQITVPAHGDGAFLALDVVIQGLGGEDQVTDPYLLTVKEEKCFMNNLPNDLDPAEASYENTGKIAKKHLIQTNITRIQEATADYEELPGRVRNKCEGKEIFKGGYKFLSQEQYEESMETENFIGHSQSSTNLIRTKRGGPQCMREYKCTYDGGRGCFCFGSTHIYDGQREKCVCCKRNCPQSTIGNDCKCGDLRAETFLNCNNSQDYDGFPYPTEDTCTSPTNGGWGSWTSWSECSSGSNPTKRRSRQCNDPEPANEGNDCSGDSEETKNCPVDGGWGSWTSWSSCCTKRRSRNCDNPAPSNGGVNCSGDQDETVVEDCRPVDGGWGSWASWSSCFIGPNRYQIRERSRLCDNPAPSNGGVNCPGNSEETENCSGPKVQPCFVSGGPAAGEP